MIGYSSTSSPVTKTPGVCPCCGQRDPGTHATPWVGLRDFVITRRVFRPKPSKPPRCEVEQRPRAPKPAARDPAMFTRQTLDR